MFIIHYSQFRQASKQTETVCGHFSILPEVCSMCGTPLATELYNASQIISDCDWVCIGQSDELLEVYRASSCRVNHGLLHCSRCTP